MSKAKPVAICHTTGQVYKAVHADKPWKAYLEFNGPNPKNKGGTSHKFWEVTGRGAGPVTVRWGAIGHGGSSQEVTYEVAQKRLASKVYDGGYEFTTE